MDLSKLDEFVKALNKVRACKTPEELARIQVHSIELGDALSVAYICNAYALQCVVLETSFLPKFGGSEVGTCVQVAFILAGCTHATML